MVCQDSALIETVPGQINLLRTLSMNQIDLLDRKFKIIAVNKGFVTRGEMDRAMGEQARLAAAGKPQASLADILISSGVLTVEQQQEILQAPKKNSKKQPINGDASAAVKDPSTPEVVDIGFGLTVSDDLMEAHIFPKERNSANAALTELKAWVAAQGIKFGLVEEDKINAYLAQNPLPSEPWLIAAGEAPAAGKNPAVKYHFDRSPLKAGTLTESGTIDFKDRGKIPQFHEGDLVAEKIPGTEGTPGTNIQGKPIAPPKLKEIKFKGGKGTQMSENRLKIFAQINGRPEVIDEGIISIQSVLDIPGDVGLETGHIEFAGHIEVRGSIHDGFRVKGQSLHADQIGKAKIEVDEDVIIRKGINGAKIKAGGTVNAKFIYKSEIDALGDVEVEKEIRESSIDTDGLCLVKRGKLLASRIDARQGIESVEIGSGASKPCTLIVGVNSRLAKTVNEIKSRLTEKEKVKTDLQSIIDENQQAADQVDQEITSLADEEGNVLAQRVPLENKIKALRDQPDSEMMAKAEEAIQQIDARLTQLQETVGELFEKQEYIAAERAGHQRELNDCEKEVQGMCDEINNISELAKKEKVKASVKASGNITARTIINGPHASLTCPDNYQRVCLRETKIADAKSNIRWNISISPL